MESFGKACDNVSKNLNKAGKLLSTTLTTPIVALGTAGSAALARKLGAPLRADGRIAVDEKQQTGIPGLYAAGDCTGGMLQVCKAVYEGALAATEAIKMLRGKNN